MTREEIEKYCKEIETERDWSKSSGYVTNTEYIRLKFLLSEISRLEERNEKLKVKINHLAEDIRQMEETIKGG